MRQSPPRASAAPSRRRPDLLSSTNARLAAARRLTRRSARRETGRFLAEGAQSVREALAADAVVELFATAAALERNAEIVGTARSLGIRVDEVSAKDAAALSETVTPQGLVAVCRATDVPLTAVLEQRSAVLVGLVEPADPGNAGTILRTADAAGAGAVVFAGDAVDPYNGKVLRASAGSVFHVQLVAGHPPEDLVAAARTAGYQVLGTSGAGTVELYDLDLVPPTLWLFGNEAHGLPRRALDEADHAVRVPVYGRAESLNLAAAAAICLYASARAQRAARSGQ